MFLSVAERLRQRIDAFHHLTSSYTQDQVEWVRATWNELNTPTTIHLGRKTFFARWFEMDPNLANTLLKGVDLKDLGNACHTYLQQIINTLEDRSKLTDMLEEMGRRMVVGHGLRDVHCEHVASAFLWTVEQALGDIYVDEIQSAWRTVVLFVRETICHGVGVAALRGVSILHETRQRRKELRTLTLQEVAQHTQENSLWTIVGRRVYDLTSFVRCHPGGKLPLDLIAGRDCTTMFEQQHGHAEHSRSLLEGMVVGVLANDVDPEDSHSGKGMSTPSTPTPTTNFISPIQRQIVQDTWAQIAPLHDRLVAAMSECLSSREWGLRPCCWPPDMNVEEHCKRIVEILAKVLQHIENLNDLVPELKELGRRHAMRGVWEADYDALGAALLWVLEGSPTWSCHAKEAWATLLVVVTDIMIEGAEGNDTPTSSTLPSQRSVRQRLRMSAVRPPGIDPIELLAKVVKEFPVHDPSQRMEAAHQRLDALYRYYKAAADKHKDGFAPTA